MSTNPLLSDPGLLVWPEVQAMRACVRHLDFPPGLLLGFHESIANMRPQILSLLEEELKQQGCHPSFHFFRGLVHEKAGETTQALSKYQTAKQKCDRLDWQPYWKSLLLLSELTRTSEALEDACEMLRRRPDLPWAANLAEKLRLQQYLAPFSTEPHKVRVSASPSLLIYYNGFASFSKVGGGSEAAALELARMAQSSGFFGSVHCAGELVKEEEQQGGIKLLTLPKDPAEAERFIAAYDIAIFISSLPAIKSLQKTPGKVWILYSHCWDVAEDELFRVGDFDLVWALSELQKKHFVDGGLDFRKTAVLPNHIDIKLFRPLPGVARNDYALMFCGAVVPHKKVHLLLQAFFLLKSDFPALELDIYGSSALWRDPDEYEKMLQRFASEWVRFRGAVSKQELPEIYSRHGLVCVPSELESFSLVSVEAQACGCIPLLHAAGGTGATLLKDVTGFLYQPNDIETLVPALRRAIQATVSNPGMRAKAAEFAAQTFSAEQAFQSFSRLLENHFIKV